jgi:predicted nucleotidyltransferase component of viral defense system
MIHSETVTTALLEIAQQLCGNPQLNMFRIVGGTAIALHIGHRESVDIDFFTHEKVNKREILLILRDMFPGTEYNITQHSISAEINEVRVELFDEWHTPFLEKPVIAEGLRLASLPDLAALKLDAIIGRREKKDYIDLYFVFQTLGALHVLQQFKFYNPHVSEKSVLFALGEVETARDNKSVMPEMLINLPWATIEHAMIGAAREFIIFQNREQEKT